MFPVLLTQLFSHRTCEKIEKRTPVRQYDRTVNKGE